MPALLLLPALIWIFVFFLLPLVLMCWRSLAAEGYSFKAYWMVFSSPLYTKVMLTTLETASIATVLALLLAYPMAYTLTITRGIWRGLLLMFVFIPYWVDIIVRTFSWLILLGDHGLINKLLRKSRHHPCDRFRCFTASSPCWSGWCRSCCRSPSWCCLARCCASTAR